MNDEQKPRLDWKKTLLIGFGFFGISLMWQTYDSFVPLYLQSGNPLFASSRNVLGFGLSAALTGFIMTLDNIVAIFILPLIGVWSDRTRTKIGRRYPYILAATPLAALAFFLIPFGANRINPATNGSLSDNPGAFVTFIVGASLMLLAMAVMRTPVVSLMPDLTPSPLRSKANGAINLMGGIGSVIAALGLARFFDLNQYIPFVVASVMLVLAMVVLFITTREPKIEDLEAATSHEESDEELARRASVRGMKSVPANRRRSLTFLLLAIFFWFVGYSGISTFFTSFAVDTLGVSEGFAPTLFGVALIAFIVFALPAGFIGEKIGRKKTIMIGLAIFGSLLVLGYFIRNTIFIGIVLGLGGMGWALVNINSLPMVVDMTDDPKLLGTLTGMYYLASQLASSSGPTLSGLAIDLAGRDYAAVFLLTPAFFVLSLICMANVKHGEAIDA